MHVTTFNRVASAIILSASTAPALAGGHAGAAVFRPGGAVHGGFRPGGAVHGGFDGGRRGGAFRGLPPISGVIHERAGGRPYLSPYGHTDTAARFGLGRGGASAFRPGNGAFAADYGHLGTGLRFAGRGRRAGYGGLGYGGLGGYGTAGTYGLGGTYGAPGIYGDAGVYGRQGTYGQAGTYGGGTYATQSLYGNGGFASYRSETPLAVRYAEPPLAPSPYAPYSSGDRYAYAAAADVGPRPRGGTIHRAAGADCACGGPVIYRYGVGTAY